MEIRLSFSLLCNLLFVICSSGRDAIQFHDKTSDVGDVCENQSGVKGVCKIVKNCPWAKDQLKNGNRNLKQCGYKGFDQIVCCPITGDTCFSSGIEGRCCLKKDCPIDSESKESLEKCDKSFPDIFCCPTVPTARNSVAACDKINLKSKEATRHVINGDFADEGEFPHMAALGFATDDGISFKCGASLISDKFLLTAGHCILRETPRIARLGVTQLNDSNYRDVPVRSGSIHPNYSIETKFNDIALIELRDSISFTAKITPACLYMKDDIPPTLTVSGWGKTGKGDEDDRSNDLMKAKLKPMVQEDCVSVYANRFRDITDTQFCANGVANNSDACRGDSGGPMQIREHGETGKFFIVGIVSFGPSSCGGSVPGIYTKVSHFVDWIENKVWPQK